MRITTLQIDGFGRLTDRSVGPLERPVTVFYGPNEAGKSTLLEFVRRVLFGFPDGRSRANPYPPLSGGRHGGRVTIATDAGELITIQRTSGRGDGPVTLSSGAGEAIPAEELPKLLGNHSKSVFENIFAFTLDELNDDSLLNDDNVNLQIYSAGIGAMRLPAALTALDRQKRAIFAPRGRNRLVPNVVESIEQTDSKLQEVAGYATEYRRQSDRLAEIDRGLKDAGERRLRLMSEKERHEDLIRAWEPWNDLINAEQQLAELPTVDEFPDNGIVLLESLETRAETASQETALAEERVKRIRTSVEQEIEHLTILKWSNLVSELERARSAFDQSVKDLPERRSELSNKRSELEASLANLGSDWDTERLNGFDVSLVVREEVAGYGERLQNARTAIERTQTALAQEETALADAQEDAERAQANRDNTAPPDLGDNDIRERRRRVRRSRDTLGQQVRLEERGKDLREQVDDDPESSEGTANGRRARLLAGLVGLVGVALLVAGILLAWTTWPGGGSTMAVVGAALSTAAAFLFYRGRSYSLPTASPVTARIRRQISEVDEQLAGIQSQLQAERDALDLEALDADTLLEAEDGLDAAETRLSEWQQVEARLAQAIEGSERQTLRRNEAQQSAQAAEAALGAEEQAWQGWLQRRALLGTFSPDGIQELRTLADLARTHQRDVSDMENRIAAIQTDIDQFINMGRTLAENHGFDIDWSDYAKVCRCGRRHY